MPAPGTVSANRGLASALTIDDLKQLARRRVPKMFFEYADSGSFTEQTYRANTTDFDRIWLRQRVGIDIDNRSVATTMLGEPVTMPVGLAPTGLTGMQIADGEIKAAKAAEAYGVPFTLSTMAICSIEDIAENTTRPFWFQLYVMRDRSFVERLIDRAKAARCSALVLTMDLTVLGQRHKDVRNGLSAPPRFSPVHVWQVATRPAWALRMLGTRRYTFRNIHGHVESAGDLRKLADWTNSQFDPRITWKDVTWVKNRFGGPLIVKGILDAEDAVAAVNAGADAIVVSNHGGRQLDGAPSTIRALPAIVDAVANRCEVYLDGGVNSGQAVLKAMALGAKGTLIGRAFLWGLGAGGEAGVKRSLDIIRKELDVSLGFTGERDIRNVGRHNIFANDLERR